MRELLPRTFQANPFYYLFPGHVVKLIPEFQFLQKIEQRELLKHKHQTNCLFTLTLHVGFYLNVIDVSGNVVKKFIKDCNEFRAK